MPTARHFRSDPDGPRILLCHACAGDAWSYGLDDEDARHLAECERCGEDVEVGQDKPRCSRCDDTGRLSRGGWCNCAAADAVSDHLYDLWSTP